MTWQGQNLDNFSLNNANSRSRTYLEGMVPMESSEIAQVKEKLKSEKRRQQEVAEMDAQKNINKTELNRQLGDMQRCVLRDQCAVISKLVPEYCRVVLISDCRTYVEGLVMMNVLEKAKEQDKSKSEMRRRQEQSELAAQQSMVNKTMFHREFGNMMRYVQDHDKCHLPVLCKLT